MSMIIKDKSVNANVDFEDLGVEDVFKYEDRVFMKISDDKENNSYDFSKHRVTGFTRKTNVEYVQSILTLYHGELEYLMKR